MSDHIFKQYAAIFFTSLAAFLGVQLIFNFLANIPEKPVIVSYGPFPICADTKVVKPGGIVCYKIHYVKRLDIPGDITKQLILKPKDGSQEIYIPLQDTAGHLPVGDIQKKACVRIPDWIPESTGIIKLSSSYNLGRSQVSRDVAYTTEFEVRR